MDMPRPLPSEPRVAAGPVTGSTQAGGTQTGATEIAPENEFLLTVGPLRIQVTSYDLTWLRQAKQRYGAFARPLRGVQMDAVSDVLWHVHYEVKSGAGATPEVLAPEDLCRARRHGVHAGPDSTWMGQGFEARYQPSIRRVDVVGPAAIYPLDLLLQALWYASRPQSLIMHAAALHDGRWGWLCAGPSGSGKSTLASLCADHALGDELVAVEAKDDGFDLVALPFWRAQPGRFPLAAVCCLQHRAAGAEPAHRRRRLTTGEALAGLRGQVSWPTWDAVAMVQCLDVLGRWVESMPVDELAFTPRPDVWEFLTSNADVDSERGGQ